MNHLLVKKNLALISNEHLSKYIINNGEDNALTFAMRVGNFNVFKFLLKKGVNVVASNSDNMSAIHFAIVLQRFDFLYYLFEGTLLDSNDLYKF